MNEIAYLRQIQQKTTVITVPQKQKIIDKKRLHDLLMSRWFQIVDQIIDRRK